MDCFLKIGYNKDRVLDWTSFWLGLGLIEEDDSTFVVNGLLGRPSILCERQVMSTLKGSFKESAYLPKMILIVSNEYEKSHDRNPLGLPCGQSARTF